MLRNGILLLSTIMSSWPEFTDAVLKAIREQGLATVEVGFGCWLVIAVLRNARDAIQAVWIYFKPLGEEAAHSVSQWFRAMTEGQLAHTTALSELTSTIRQLDKGKMIEDIHAIASRSHEKLSELAARPLGSKAAAGEDAPKRKPPAA